MTQNANIRLNILIRFFIFNFFDLIEYSGRVGHGAQREAVFCSERFQLFVSVKAAGNRNETTRRWSLLNLKLYFFSQLSY